MVQPYFAREELVLFRFLLAFGGAGDPLRRDQGKLVAQSGDIHGKNAQLLGGKLFRDGAGQRAEADGQTAVSVRCSHLPAVSI